MPTATAVAAAAITAHLTALDAVSQVLQWICYKLETKYHLNFKRFILFSREASPFLLSLPLFLALCFKLDSNCMSTDIEFNTHNVMIANQFYCGLYLWTSHFDIFCR